MTTTVRQREVDRHVAAEHEIASRLRSAAVAQTVIAEGRLEAAIAAADTAGLADLADRLRTAHVIATSARRGVAQ